MKTIKHYLTLFCILCALSHADEAPNPIEEFTLPVSNTAAQFFNLEVEYGRMSHQEYFNASGVPFPKGAYLKFDAERNAFVIANTRDGLLHVLRLLSVVEHWIHTDNMSAQDIFDKLKKQNEKQKIIP